MDTTNIDIKGLLRDQAKLQALEDAGVYNWSGYSDAMYPLQQQLEIEKLVDKTVDKFVDVVPESEVTCDLCGGNTFTITPDEIKIRKIIEDTISGYDSILV